MAASECDLVQGDRATAEEAALPDFDESASEDTGWEPEVDDCALLGEDWGLADGPPPGDDGFEEDGTEATMLDFGDWVGWREAAWEAGVEEAETLDEALVSGGFEEGFTDSTLVFDDLSLEVELEEVFCIVDDQALRSWTQKKTRQ